MFNTQINHKAKHGGYKKRPPKKQVDALMSMYEGINDIAKAIKPVQQPKVGTQFKLNL